MLHVNAFVDPISDPFGILGLPSAPLKIHFSYPLIVSKSRANRSANREAAIPVPCLPTTPSFPKLQRAKEKNSRLIILFRLTEDHSSDQD